MITNPFIVPLIAALGSFWLGLAESDGADWMRFVLFWIESWFIYELVVRWAHGKWHGWMD